MCVLLSVLEYRGDRLLWRDRLSSDYGLCGTGLRLLLYRKLLVRGLVRVNLVVQALHNRVQLVNYNEQLLRVAVEIYLVRVKDFQVEDEVYRLDELSVYALSNLGMLNIPSINEDNAGRLARLVA